MSASHPVGSDSFTLSDTTNGRRRDIDDDGAFREHLAGELFASGRTRRANAPVVEAGGFLSLVAARTQIRARRTTVRMQSPSRGAEARVADRRADILDRFDAPLDAVLTDMTAWTAPDETRRRFLRLLEWLGRMAADMTQRFTAALSGVRTQANALASQVGLDENDFRPRGLDAFARPSTGALRVRVDISVEAFTARTGTDAETARVVMRDGKITAEALLSFCDPVVLDLDGDGFDLRCAESGLTFDMDGDGDRERTGFVRDDDALLWLDRDGDGICGDGRELFGEHHGAVDGLAELARFDDDGNLRIDADDAIMRRLRLWNDENGDGVNQADENRTLAEAGVTALDLSEIAAGTANDADRLHGNRMGRSAGFVRADGDRGRMADAWFRVC